MKVIDESFVKANLPLRPDDANKGTMGTLVNISGSYSMAGACILSSMSALRSGVGLLKVALPKSIYEIVASLAYEAVFLPLDESENGTVDIRSLDYLLEVSRKSTAVLLGCGLSLCDDTVDFVREFIKACTTKVLLDADGINAISLNTNVLKQCSCDMVLTPHPKEMSRLCKKSVEYIESNREEVATQFAKEYGVTLVLKGKDTLVTNGQDVYVNKTGNSSMAKGGSGDVLSGIISSLMAQGVDPFKASCMGVYIHGLSGDLSARDLSKTSAVPRDIVEYLPKVYKILER
ncbi:MAG: NAD(P)H-hydrate dehydratase [Ruminococcus sp.]|nr:NAD(P)H-hydrate dehydratase [Ruminococcus sp.]